MQGGYAVNRRRVRIDADEFEEAVSAGLAASARGEDDIATERLEGGLELYKGEFLADEPYSEWAYAERDRLRGLAAKALRGLATIKLEGGDLEGAGAQMERLADLEPYDNQVQRELLTIWLAQGTAHRGGTPLHHLQGADAQGVRRGAGLRPAGPASRPLHPNDDRLVPPKFRASCCVW